MPDLFDFDAVTPAPVAVQLAAADLIAPAPTPAAELPPLEPYASTEEALRAILDAFDSNGNPLFRQGFRVLTMPIADAIERARLTLSKPRS